MIKGKDKFGQDLTVGDLVVYTSRQSAGMVITLAHVVEVRVDRDRGVQVRLFKQVSTVKIDNLNRSSLWTLPKSCIRIGGPDTDLQALREKGVKLTFYPQTDLSKV